MANTCPINSMTVIPGLLWCSAKLTLVSHLCVRVILRLPAVRIYVENVEQSSSKTRKSSIVVSTCAVLFLVGVENPSINEHFCIIILTIMLSLKMLLLVSLSLLLFVKVTDYKVPF